MQHGIGNEDHVRLSLLFDRGRVFLCVLYIYAGLVSGRCDDLEDTFGVHCSNDGCCRFYFAAAILQLSWRARGSCVRLSILFQPICTDPSDHLHRSHSCCGADHGYGFRSEESASFEATLKQSTSQVSGRLPY